MSYSSTVPIMSATVPTLTPARRPGWPARLLKPGNLLPAAVWTFLVFNQAYLSPFPPSPSTVMLIFIQTVSVALFMLRRDASLVGGKLDTLIALAGTFSVAFLKGGNVRDLQLLPTSIQLIALLGWAWALTSLGRSFGIVPADRGLVQHGPYRFVRHPIYAFEALFLLGYLAAVPTWRSAVIILAASALQLLRILREERIIQGYGEYQRRVRWRILPGVW